MKIKYYWKNISAIVIFEKKKFQIMCHMINYTTVEANWAGGWVIAYAKSVKASTTPLPNSRIKNP